MRGAQGKARIGNRRSECVTCNRFNQRVIRETRKRLKEKHEDEYARLRMEVERDLYVRVIQEFSGD